jgi:LPS-assembly protein
MLRVLFSLVFLAFAAALRAQPAAPPVAPSRISADSSETDLATGETLLKGHALVETAELILTADEIRYNSRARTAAARGNVVLTRGTQRLVADSGTYNLETRRLKVANLRLGQFPVYLSGESVEGTLDELHFTNATIFFRENARYTPALSAEKITWRRGEVVAASGLRLGLLGGRFLSLPRFEHSLKADFISYITAKVGYRHSLGVFGEFGAHLPVAPGLNLGAEGGLYSARGLLIGPAGHYTLGGGKRTGGGTFRSGYINDFGDKKLDVLRRAVPEERGFFEWSHWQRPAEGWSMQGQFNYWSDSEIIRDFRPKEFHPVQEPDSYFEAAYAGDNFTLGAFARLHPNRFQRTQERLPEVTFDLLPSPAPLGFTQRLHASAARLEEDTFLAAPQTEGTRLDAYYGLSRTFAPAPWFAFTPVAGARSTHYADATGGNIDYTRSFAEVGFDAHLTASATFDTKNEIWEVDGLRHLVVPRLSYRYAPDAGDGRRHIPALDRRVFATYLQPLSIADRRHIDDLDRLDTLRLQLDNILQTRADYGSRNLASLSVAADYDFTYRRPAKGLGDLHTELSLTPAPWLRLSAYERYDVHARAQNEFNTSVEISDQDWWSVRLASHYLRGDYEEYSLDWRQRLNETLDVVGRWRYDARRSRFNEQTYGVWHRLGQTWAVKYEVSFFEGPRRESSFGFNVEVDLLKF